MSTTEIGGVRHEDNPIPVWYQLFWWGSWILCFAFMAMYLPSGDVNIKEYRDAVALLNKKRPLHARKTTESVLAGLDRSPAAIKEGRVIFLNSCAACHNKDAKGLIGPDLTDDTWLHADTSNKLVDIIMNGIGVSGSPYKIMQKPPKGPMTPQRYLGINRIKKVIAYLETISPSLKRK